MFGLQRSAAVLAAIWGVQAGLVLPVNGGGGPPNPSRPLQADGLFDRLDANRDGQVDTSETPAEHRRLFDRLLRTSDRDGDGQLSRNELRRGLTPSSPDKPITPPQSAELRDAKYARLLLLKLDTDRDQSLTRDEAPSELRGAFDRVAKIIDRNNDGVVSRFELNRAGPRLIGNGRQVARRLKWDVDAELARFEREQGDAVYRFDNPIGPVEALRNPKRAGELFGQLDVNGDRKLTRDEVPERARDRFDRLFLRADANRDNALSRQEYMTASRQVARFLQRTGLAAPEPIKKQAANKKADQASRQGDPPTASTLPDSALPAESVAERLMRRMLERADRNGDGRLERAEATGPMTRRFDRADENGDGVLDPKELAAATRRLDEKLRSTGRNSGQDPPSSRSSLLERVGT